MRRRTLYIIIAVAAVVIAAVVVLFLMKNGGSAAPSTSGVNGTLPSVATGGGTGAGSGNPGNGSSGANGTGGTTGSGGNVEIVSPNTLGGSSAGAQQTFGKVSDEPVLAYSIDPKNNVTIIEPDGRVASILNGQPTFLSTIAIQNIDSASFSYDGAFAFVSFGDPTNPQTSIFNVASKSWTPMPAGMMSPVWSPSDERFAYLMANTNGGEALYTLNASSTRTRAVALTTVYLQNEALSWPTKNLIIFSDRPSSFETGSEYVFNIPQGTFSQPLAPAAGLDAIWSNGTSSEFAVVFNANPAERDGTLSLWNQASDTMQQLNFLTMPSKCAFNNEVVTSTIAVSSTAQSAPSATSPTISRKLSAPPAAAANLASVMRYVSFYCGIPQDQTVFSGQALPDEYDQMAIFTVDSLYRIRADSGTMVELLTPPIPIDATELHVANGILFFVNRYDSKLYALSLGS